MARTAESNRLSVLVIALHKTNMFNLDFILAVLFGTYFVFCMDIFQIEMTNKRCDRNVDLQVGFSRIMD